MTDSRTGPGIAAKTVASDVSRSRQWILAVVTGIAFFSWLGYLIYLVQISPRGVAGPLVLSRPQFLISELDVVAELKSLHEPVRILEVIQPENAGREWIGKSFLVRNLDQCHPQVILGDEEIKPDFQGPGKYILPLRVVSVDPLLSSIGLLTNPFAALPHLVLGLGSRDANQSPLVLEVAPTPPSPGYPRNPTRLTGPPRIYPDIPYTRSQARSIRKAG